MDNIHFIHEGQFESKFIEFINNYGFNEYNKFLIFSNNNAVTNIKTLPNVLINNINLKKDYISVKRKCENVDKIFIHGLFAKQWVLFFYLNPKLLKKAVWVIWGGDLYYYKYRNINFKSNLYENILRRTVIKNLSEIGAIIKGDYDIAKKIYATNAKYKYIFYPNPVNFKFLDNVTPNERNNNILKIQIGNSADPNNEHLEILNNLIKFKDKKIKIICPLSYGNKTYANKITEYGFKLFGDKFEPLTEYLVPEEYSKVLSDVDIAIFNHRRQNALGNIISLLYLGKKVYIRSEITPWGYFRDLGVKLNDTINLNNLNFKNFIETDDQVRKTNKEIVAKEFSEEHCVELWKKVLENKGE